MNNFRKIYERLRQTNQGVSEEQLRRQAWVINDRQMFESSLSSSSSSSSSAGAGAGSKFRCVPEGGITVILSLNPDVAGFSGNVQLYFYYDGLYNGKESFRNNATGWYIQWNPDDNWQIVVEDGVIATSVDSPYYGWVIEFPLALEIVIRCGNVCQRNLCLLVNGTDYQDSVEIFNYVNGSGFAVEALYTCKSYVILFIKEVGWIIQLDSDTVFLGGSLYDFPFGEVEIGGNTVLISNGLCPIII